MGHAIRSQQEGYDAHHRPAPAPVAHPQAGEGGRRTPTGAEDDDKYKKWGTIN